MFVVTYILGMESEAVTSLIRHEDGYSEYASTNVKEQRGLKS